MGHTAYLINEGDDVKGWIKSAKDYRDFLSIVMLSAPDDFPSEEYLPESERLTLDNSFGYLLEALDHVDVFSQNKKFKIRLKEMLIAAYEKYKNGDVVDAAKTLQTVWHEIDV